MAIVGITWAVIVCMVLHAWVDFTVHRLRRGRCRRQVALGPASAPSSGAPSCWLFIGLFLVLRRGSTADSDSDAAGAHAAA